MGKLLPQIWVKFGTIDIHLHKSQPVAVQQRKMTNKTNHILFVSGMSIVFNQTSNINYTGLVKDIWEFNQIAPCPEYLGQYVTGNNGFGFHRKSYVPWFWLWWDRIVWKRNIIWSIQKKWSIKLYNVNDSNA